jgi:hypothetical protein
MQITIKTPSDFNFQRTVLSHGWCELLPFELDRRNWILTRVLDVGRARPVTVRISFGKRGLKVTTSREVNETAAARIVRDVRHMMRLDDDLQVLCSDVCGCGLCLDYMKAPGGCCDHLRFTKIW